MRKLWILILIIFLLPCKMVYAEEIGEPSGMSVQVYEHMDEESGVIANVIQGTTFLVLASDSDANGVDWCYIRTDLGVEGYIHASEMKSKVEDIAEESHQQTGVNNIITIDNVNIRELPSIDTEIVGKIPKDTVLIPLQVQENEEGERWYQIEYGGVVGYVRDSAVNNVGQSGADRDDAVQDDADQDNAGQNDADQVDEEQDDADRNDVDMDSVTQDDIEAAVAEQLPQEMQIDVKKDAEGSGETSQEQIQQTTSDVKKAESAEKIEFDAEVGMDDKKTTRRWANPIDFVVIALLIGIIISAFATIRTFQVIRIVQRRKR